MIHKYLWPEQVCKSYDGINVCLLASYFLDFTRRAYADRKAELSRTNHIVYNPCCSLNQNTMVDLPFPESSCHSICKNNVMGAYGSGMSNFQLPIGKCNRLIL